MSRATTHANRLPPLLATAAALWLLAHALLFLPLSTAVAGTLAWGLLATPGVLLAWLLFQHEPDRLYCLLLAFCGALALPPLVLLALHPLPGPLVWWQLLLACDALSLWLGWQVWPLGHTAVVQFSNSIQTPQSHKDTKAQRVLYSFVSWCLRVFAFNQPVSRSSHWLALGGLVLLGALLRLVWLGSSEFQGDEARALLLAQGILGGRDDLLLVHKKGPLEVLLPAGPLALVGRLDEWAARLPFALAGVGVLLAAYVLARALFDKHGRLAGLIACGILAVDGLSLGFARIVQYQSVLVLMVAGAISCGWRFYQGGQPGRRYLLCGAALAALALLAHYDGAFVLPALAWLVLAGARRHGWGLLRTLREVAVPLLVFAGLVGSFYLPFVLNEQFSRTADYLAGRATGDAAFTFNNLPDFYTLLTVYNTTLQVQTLALALAAGLVAWLLRYLPRGLGWPLAGLLLVGAMVQVLDPARFALASANWALVAFGLPLVGLLLAPRTPAALRLVLLWWGVPFVAQAFLLLRPGTHYYVFALPAALLIGLAGAQSWAVLAHWLRGPRPETRDARRETRDARRETRDARRETRDQPLPSLLSPVSCLLSLHYPALGLLSAGWLLFSAGYAYVAFVRPAPEFLADFPDARPAIYRAAYGDSVPRVGYFGFQHRAGWKVIDVLYQQGVLQGDYETNEDYYVSQWYARSAPRCERAPAYYLVVATASASSGFTQHARSQGFGVLGWVTINGKREITIYQRVPPPGPPQTYELRDYSAMFDTRALLPAANQPLRVTLEPLPLPAVGWNSALTLQSLGIDNQRLVAGQAALLWINWRLDLAPAGPLEVVAELQTSAGQAVRQLVPQCSSVNPAEWALGRRSKTSFSLLADARLVAGHYQLVARLRDPNSGAWLPLADGRDGLPVADVVVMP